MIIEEVCKELAADWNGEGAAFAELTPKIVERLPNHIIENENFLPDEAAHDTLFEIAFQCSARECGDFMPQALPQATASATTCGGLCASGTSPAH